MNCPICTKTVSELGRCVNVVCSAYSHKVCEIEPEFTEEPIS